MPYGVHRSYNAADIHYVDILNSPNIIDLSYMAVVGADIFYMYTRIHI